MSRTLKEYFNSVADLLQTRSKLAGDSSENTDIGSNRERICSNLLNNHVPRRLGVHLGGDVFGVGGYRSGQIDILVTHDMSINFMENDKIRCSIESLTCAISVKSHLNKASISNALTNLASIPQCHGPSIGLGLLTRPVSEYLLSWPSSFIFAFDGVSMESCVSSICDHYSNTPAPFNRIPRAVIVNNKYMIRYLHYDIPNATHETKFDPTHLKLSNLTEEQRGAPLLWLMAELAKGITWLDGMNINYSAYFSEAYR